ncbi:probable G-protein coupled receptor 158 [Lingula anatina]|uniref:Probable G-protein coupled receptor 158 n=1 Tax=Lingula anatina TaxID=7574 RepID=A0A1S3IH72_LINAN|nr:probable G-protein coupled receptor 158 [Lingula anatina]XP_013396834.1 probable G-protein coupled receptor 158 [Lingula anatina]|eukprot:XP_013396833.1 probable G-protein coupled receptor 158 [Lingula anatina]
MCRYVCEVSRKGRLMYFALSLTMVFAVLQSVTLNIAEGAQNQTDNSSAFSDMNYTLYDYLWQNDLPDGPNETLSFAPKSTEPYDAMPLPTSPPPSSHNASYKSQFNHSDDVVADFLAKVEQYERNKQDCDPGTHFNLGDGVIQQYGVLRFKRQALEAVTRANFLTRIWKLKDFCLKDNEYFFYDQVRSMVEGDPEIFAAGNCYDKDRFKDYYLFCPYSHRLPNGQIVVKDLSVSYKYLGNTSEFFWEARRKANLLLEHANLTQGLQMMRLNDTAHYDPEVDESLLVSYEDGHWSRPYFDCMGADIWMITYTVPFFGYENGTFFFKGTSGIDIDLQKVDINQCPLPEGSKETNVFAGSARCKPTSECEPMPGLGFRRGSYLCKCRKGFYFPVENAEYKYFNGTDVEDEYEKKRNGDPSSVYDESFECLPCADGCTECDDSSPCYVTTDAVLRTIILILSLLFMCSVPVWAVFTRRNTDVKVLKASSPVLLNIMLLGAFFLYCPMIVNYFPPSEIACSVRLWCRGIGFSILYGALLLKTWRISVVFRVRSAQRIKISDADLIKRLIFIVSVFATFLSIRMGVGRPNVITGYDMRGLKANLCIFDVWDYCGSAGETLLLLWGIRLCISVRKAPSEFNESRFISWAIYNETLLSVFLTVSMYFLQSIANPDVMYVVLFVHTQLTVTVTLAFLFGSKAYLVFKYKGRESMGSNSTAKNSKMLLAGRTKSSMLETCTYVDSKESAMNGEKIRTEEPQEFTLEKEVQEEFMRLYTQLELLRQKNMKLGNPHLSYKLNAMTSLAKTENAESMPSSPNILTKKSHVVINLDDFKDATAV